MSSTLHGVPLDQIRKALDDSRPAPSAAGETAAEVVSRLRAAGHEREADALSGVDEAAVVRAANGGRLPQDLRE